MTLTQLKSVAASCKSDAEFVNNPKVREVYWKCLGEDGKPQPTCPIPDPIPGSLLDAGEVLRKKVVEKANQWCDGIDEDKTGPIVRRLCAVDFQHISDLLLISPIDRFLVFAACLGGVTMEEK